jgi:AGZA family xanthine/uracil permease-like MFS transporter
VSPKPPAAPPRRATRSTGTSKSAPASTALVVVGFLMMTAVRTIDWSDFEIAIPAFLAIVLMPFTYSISNGIGAGVIAFVLLKAVRGKFREIHPLLYGVAALFVLYFLRGVLEQTIM